jgi:hypothetical protein
MLSVTRSRAFPCARPDEAAQAVSVDSACGGELVYLSPQVPHYCQECGCEHWIEEDTPDLTERVRIRIIRAGVTAKLEGLLTKVDDRHRRMPDAVAWRAFVDERDVFVCVLDWSTTSRYATWAFASTNPVVYVVVDWRRFQARFRDAPGQVLPLYQLVVDETRLVQAMAQAAQSAFGPMLASEPPPPVWNPLRETKPRIVRQQLGARELVVGAGSAMLDGVEVLGSRAAGLLPVLRFLVARWREDLVDGKQPEDHCCFTVDEIREGMRAPDGRASASGTVRKQLTRLRERISANYLRRAGSPLGPDAVVEHVEGLGYRLSSTGLAARLRDT